MIVTGRHGQVVRSLVERAAGTQFDIVPLGRPGIDFAGPAASVVSAVERARPDVIVSAAAYTQVDQAETDADQAFAVNAAGPQALARAARELQVPLIHLSTDYVFDGFKGSPYVEDDPTRPQGVYGASKLEGERTVIAEQRDSAVLRTAWVYSPFGTNFVKTMLRLAGDRDEIAVVADQRGNPTSALDLADGILAVAANLAQDADPSLRGVFHVSASGEASWAEFAEAIFAASGELGGPTARVKRILAADYPTPARRPANSRLDSSKLTRAHGVRLPEWRQSVKQVVSRLVQNGA
jgi:dTDP-4-dehydrorhamnose reductase